ncbi:MAG: hypothetical protein ACRD3P_02765 [Terriglobales bacterium]
MGLPIRRLIPEPHNSNVVKFTPVTPATNATLQGWKEIAAELDRSVRTVQRWEQKMNLPVHKLGSGGGAPVFAFKDELHSWLRAKADDRKNTKIARPSKNASDLDDELSVSGPRRGAMVERRQNSQSRTASEPEIIKSPNAFFALKQANTNSHSCNHCHASSRLLVGHFWLYGTDRTWQVAVPFCPNCDSDLRAMLPSTSERLT